MNASLACADLEIRILAQQTQGYPVELTLDQAREFARGYLDPTFLPWQPQATPAADGARLFAWLWADDKLKTAWTAVRSAHPHCRIRLRIDATAPELHALPWELLCATDAENVPTFIAASTATPFSRYFAGAWQPGSPILQRPIKILAVIANPSDLAAYSMVAFDPAAEFQILQAATHGLEVELVQFPAPVTGATPPHPCTLAALEAELKKGYHILHIIGHGSFTPGAEAAVLVMADAENRVAFVNDVDFAAMLARQLADTGRQQDAKLRLVYLDSCESATRDSADALRGFAPTLVKAGVPAVVAMQAAVAVVSSQAFSRTFYHQLLQHGQVDLAANEARSALLTARLPGAEAPVLFMRLRDGQLLGQRGQILGENADSFWNTLLDNIADGVCTPFLGAGVTAALLPGPGELAQTLAVANNYPFLDLSDFPRVAQFMATTDKTRLRNEVQRMLVEGFKRRMNLPAAPSDRRSQLTALIAAADWSQRCRQVFETELHHLLADLELPLYITTNFDNFMALALANKLGKPVRRLAVDWRAPLRQTAARPHFDLEPPLHKDDPVVLHLFGNDDDVLSMVLSEDDYLDYLARIARDYEYLLPTSVTARLARTTLLFLGYRLEDLDLKIILRGLLTHLDLERWGMLHVAVQLEAATIDEAKQREVVRYFQRYFAHSRIDVYWGSTQQFIADLHARWQEYRHG